MQNRNKAPKSRSTLTGLGLTPKAERELQEKDALDEELRIRGLHRECLLGDDPDEGRIF